MADAGPTGRTIHVAIVSDQLLANVIPALMERPAKVYLACSAEMATRGVLQRLVRFLRGHAIDVVPVEGAPDAGLHAVHEFALELLGRVQAECPGAQIVLNATGGNKLMALGFVEVFRGAAAAILYADTQHRRIEHLPLPKRDARPAEPMIEVLDIPGYLGVQGFRYDGARSDDPAWREAAARRKEATKHLGHKPAELASFFGAINGLAQQAFDSGERLVAPVQSFDHVTSVPWKEALGALTRKGIVKWFGDRDVEFTDAEATRFCGGGWLEEYAWHVLRDEGAHDARLGVTGRWEVGHAAESRPSTRRRNPRPDHEGIETALRLMDRRDGYEGSRSAKRSMKRSAGR